MKRFFLRAVENPASDFPKRVRGSTIAKWFWCAEQFRHSALGLLPEEEPDEPKEVCEVGTMMHKVLEESMGRRFPWEEQFMEKLQTLQNPELGFTRNVSTTTIYCDLTTHPDDLQITPDFMVSVIENKTVEMRDPNNPDTYFIERFKLPMAKFQSQVYSYVLEPIVNKLGAVMNRYNAVQYWDRNTFKLVKWYPVEYYPVQTRENILRALGAIKDPTLVIKPQAWKCRCCFKEHKELCQFEKSA